MATYELDLHGLTWRESLTAITWAGRYHMSWATFPT